MKTRLLAAAMLLAAVSCTKEQADDFGLEDTAVEVPSASCSARVRYRIVSPVPGREVKCSCNADWIEKIDTGSLGSISVEVAPNTSDAPRETVVNVSYGQFSDSFTLTQSFSKEGIGTDETPFEIVIEDASAEAVRIRVVAGDPVMPYYAGLIPVPQIEGLSDEEIIDAVIPAIMFDACYPAENYQEFLENILYKGDTQLSSIPLYRFEDYLVFVFGLDWNFEPLSGLARMYFTAV